jgi:hypothetical protein
MDINKDQAEFYRQARERCRADVEQMNNTILTEWQRVNDEWTRVMELIETLEARKVTVGQIYASSSEMLNLDNDLVIARCIDGEGEDSAEDLGVGEIDL